MPVPVGQRMKDLQTDNGGADGHNESSIRDRSRQFVLSFRALRSMDDYEYGEGARLHCPPFIKKLWDLLNGPYKEVRAMKAWCPNTFTELRVRRLQYLAWSDDGQCIEIVDVGSIAAGRSLRRPSSCPLFCSNEASLRSSSRTSSSRTSSPALSASSTFMAL